MITTLVDFNYKIDALEKFLLSTECETILAERLLRNPVGCDEATTKLVERVLQVRTDKKRYIYLIGIVGLYGILEKFIQEILSGYAQVLGLCVSSYENLPEIFRKNHLDGSIDLLKAIREERYDLGIDEVEVISNLHSCLCSHEPYHINKKVFGYHRGNINFRKIEELVSRLAIRNFTGRLFRIAEAQVPEMLETPPNKRRFSDEEARSFFNPVDDLVDRRNQLSHGDLITDDIESIELMKNRCGFIRVFGRAVVTILQQEWTIACIKAKKVLPMGKPHGVYGNNVVCLPPPNDQSL